MGGSHRSEQPPFTRRLRYFLNTLTHSVMMPSMTIIRAKSPSYVTYITHHHLSNLKPIPLMKQMVTDRNGNPHIYFSIEVIIFRLNFTNYTIYLLFIFC